MIDLHYWPTPNGWKVTIMLEECGLEYRVVPVNIRQGDQFAPEFLAISPNNRMPALLDHEALGGSISIFESGAILVYLAEKTGRFMPADLHGRFEVLQWLFWQVGGLGPGGGQLNHFISYAEEEHAYAVQRFRDEYDRLLGVMDRRLADRDFLAGDYSIADMASWPWMISYRHFGQSLDHLPNVKRWHQAMKARPAASRGIDVGKELRQFGTIDDKARQVMFGQTAQSVKRDAHRS
jgi:GST-like protein